MKKLHLDFSELLKVLNSSTFFPPADHLTALNYFNRLEPDLLGKSSEIVYGCH